ncbi:hypothetical protein Goklo_027855, partial [Gossypium klotzschianum]|nr:hypothetical protein [Gossypium klotzschianum]
MEKDMADLCLEDEEEEVLQFGEKIILQKSGYDLCLLKEGEDPNLVHLVFTDFWVQEHDFLLDFFLDNVGMGIDFFRKILDIGMQEVVGGWDLSLKAQQMREMITSSVWLREDNYGDKMKETDLSGGTRSVDMEDDSEELHLINSKGKKRPKLNKQISGKTIGAFMAEVTEKIEEICRKGYRRLPI